MCRSLKLEMLIQDSWALQLNRIIIILSWPKLTNLVYHTDIVILLWFANNNRSVNSCCLINTYSAVCNWSRGVVLVPGAKRHFVGDKLKKIMKFDSDYDERSGLLYIFTICIRNSPLLNKSFILINDFQFFYNLFTIVSQSFCPVSPVCCMPNWNNDI